MTVPLKPVPQGDLNWTSTRPGEKAHAYHANSAELHPYREAIGAVAAARLRSTGRPTFDGPLCIGLVFEIPRPRTVDRAWPTVPPDIDKLTRAVLDALKPVRVIADDARVVRLTAEKVYGPRGAVHITIWEAPCKPTSVLSLLRSLYQSATSSLSGTIRT